MSLSLCKSKMTAGMTKRFFPPIGFMPLYIFFLFQSHHIPFTDFWKYTSCGKSTGQSQHGICVFSLGTYSVQTRFHNCPFFCALDKRLARNTSLSYLGFEEEWIARFDKSADSRQKRNKWQRKKNCVLGCADKLKDDKWRIRWSWRKSEKWSPTFYKCFSDRSKFP